MPTQTTFNPYTGCDHGCLYCYATSYIPNHQTLRTKQNLLPTLRREVSKLNGEILAMSSSSDPYPTVEAELGLTRQCLKIVAQSNCRLQVFTKSDIVARDADLLREIPSTVAITITTDDDALAATSNPKPPHPANASKPSKPSPHTASQSSPASTQSSPP